MVIIGTDSKFGVDLSTQAAKSYNTKTIVAAKRGTIYDRNGNVLAEDSTSYSIYAIVSTSYVSPTREKLYVQESQFDKVADILKDKLGIKKSYTLAQLRTKGCLSKSILWTKRKRNHLLCQRRDLERLLRMQVLRGWHLRQQHHVCTLMAPLHQSFLVVLNLLKIKRWFLFFDWSNGFGAFA